MTEKFNYLSLPRITKFSLALYQKLISMGMHLILQSLVLVSKIAQFKSYAAGLSTKCSWIIKLFIAKLSFFLPLSCSNGQFSCYCSGIFGNLSILVPRGPATFGQHQARVVQHRKSAITVQSTQIWQIWLAEDAKRIPCACLENRVWADVWAEIPIIWSISNVSNISNSIFIDCIIHLGIESPLPGGGGGGSRSLWDQVVQKSFRTSYR